MRSWIRIVVAAAALAPFAQPARAQDAPPARSAVVPTAEQLAAYAARAGKLTGADAAGWATLARWAAKQGLTMEARGAWTSALRADPNHAAARAALGYVKFKERWMLEAQAKRAKGFVRYRGRWVLPAERRYLRKRDARAAGDVVAGDPTGYAGSLAHPDPDVRKTAERVLRALPADDRVRVLATALEHHAKAAARAAACDLLAEIRDLGAVRALTRASVTDADPGVRGAALSALKSMQYRESPVYLASALRSKNSTTRRRAIEHLGTFEGDVQAARALADYFVVGFGGGPRVNFYSLTQIAYIRDFDVEVAQNATIGDPIVGRIEEGVVQDHKILGGQEIVPAEAFALAGAFERVTGRNLGAENPKPYREWLEQSFKNGLGGAPGATK